MRPSPRSAGRTPTGPVAGRLRGDEPHSPAGLPDHGPGPRDGHRPGHGGRRAQPGGRYPGRRDPPGGVEPRHRRRLHRPRRRRRRRRPRGRGPARRRRPRRRRPARHGHPVHCPGLPRAAAAGDGRRPARAHADRPQVHRALGRLRLAGGRVRGGPRERRTGRPALRQRHRPRRGGGPPAVRGHPGVRPRCRRAARRRRPDDAAVLHREQPVLDDAARGRRARSPPGPGRRARDRVGPRPHDGQRGRRVRRTFRRRPRPCGARRPRQRLRPVGAAVPDRGHGPGPGTGPRDRPLRGRPGRRRVPPLAGPRQPHRRASDPLRQRCLVGTRWSA